MYSRFNVLQKKEPVQRINEFFDGLVCMDIHRISENIAPDWTKNL